MALSWRPSTTAMAWTGTILGLPGGQVHLEIVRAGQTSYPGGGLDQLVFYLPDAAVWERMQKVTTARGKPALKPTEIWLTALTKRRPASSPNARIELARNRPTLRIKPKSHFITPFQGLGLLRSGSPPLGSGKVALVNPRAFMRSTTLYAASSAAASPTDIGSACFSCSKKLA